ncbi:MAG: YtxH domain-containing protein [Vicinamibacteria bacterium]
MIHHGNGYGFTRGFFLGATMGAIAALLLAPRSGREIRSGLSRGSWRLKEKAYDVASQIRERGESAVRRTRRAAESGVEEMRESSRGLGESAEEAATPRPVSST